MNFAIELEKDVKDLHLLLLSYQQVPNFGQQTRLAVFKRLQNGKYKYIDFLQSPRMVLPKSHYGPKVLKQYSVFIKLNIYR